MKHKIFVSIFSCSLFILLAAVVSVSFMLYQARINNEKQGLENFAVMLSSALNHEEDQPAFLQNLYHPDCRITLIASDGTVLFDSEAAPPYTNHAGRTEVIAAHAHGTGAVTRFSQTLEQYTYYYALLLNNDSVLRCAITSGTVLRESSLLITLTLGLVLLLGACSYCFARRLAQKIAEPFDHIDLNHPLYQDIYPEIRPFLLKIHNQQQQIEGQFREIQSKTEQMLVITRSMAEGLLLLNRDGSILTINKTARKIFNIEDDVTGLGCQAVDRSIYLEELLAKKGERKRCEIEFERDGRDYLLHFSQIAVRDEIQGYAVIIMDITETKRAERQRQEFTANVSHELKTPLQSIIGYSELIENNLVRPEDLPSFAAKIKKQGTRLVSLIEDIILLSRLDEGSESMLKEQLQFDRIIAEVFDTLAYKAEEKQVTLTHTGDSISFYGVQQYIYELIYNLCDNAVKYNRDGGKVTVETEIKPKRFIIRVKDTGIGIPPEHQRRVFERFYRVDKSHSRRLGGTGLGLSIVKRVTLFHHGKLKLSSAAGEGSCFTVSLPRTDLAGSAPTDPAEGQSQEERKNETGA